MKVRDQQIGDFIEFFMNMCTALCQNVGLPTHEIDKVSEVSLISWAQRFQERYGYMGLQEMEIAVRGSSIMEYRTKPEHFHTLSERYIYEVFDGYKEWAQTKLNEINRIIEADNEKELDPEAAQKAFIENTIIPAYVAFREKHEGKSELAYPEIFETIQEKGLVEFSPEVKWSWMDQAKGNLQEKMNKSIEGLVDAFQAKVENVEISTIKIKRLAMTYACRAAFEELENKGYGTDQLTSALQ